MEVQTCSQVPRHLHTAELNVIWSRGCDLRDQVTQDPPSNCGRARRHPPRVVEHDTQVEHRGVLVPGTRPHVRPSTIGWPPHALQVVFELLQRIKVIVWEISARGRKRSRLPRVADATGAPPLRSHGAGRTSRHVTRPCRTSLVFRGSGRGDAALAVQPQQCEETKPHPTPPCHAMRTRGSLRPDRAHSTSASSYRCTCRW